MNASMNRLELNTLIRKTLCVGYCHRQFEGNIQVRTKPNCRDIFGTKALAAWCDGCVRTLLVKVDQMQR